jgi:hypothetical protein
VDEPLGLRFENGVSNVAPLRSGIGNADAARSPGESVLQMNDSDRSPFFATFCCVNLANRIQILCYFCVIFLLFFLGGSLIFRVIFRAIFPFAEIRMKIDNLIEKKKIAQKNSE